MDDTIDAALDRLATVTEDWAEQLNVKGDLYQFLESVWRNPRVPFSIRKRAAEQCLAYDRPKLAVVAQVSEGNIAERLERALARSNGPPRLNGQTLDLKPEPDK